MRAVEHTAPGVHKDVVQAEQLPGPQLRYPWLRLVQVLPLPCVRRRHQHGHRLLGALGGDHAGRFKPLVLHRASTIRKVALGGRAAPVVHQLGDVARLDAIVRDSLLPFSLVATSATATGGHFRAGSPEALQLPRVQRAALGPEEAVGQFDDGEGAPGDAGGEGVRDSGGQGGALEDSDLGLAVEIVVTMRPLQLEWQDGLR